MSMDFVTGGTGLIGSHVIFDLLKKGRKVKALKREGSNTEILTTLAPFYNISTELIHTIEWVTLSLWDQIGLEEALVGCENIYHCAAIVSFEKGQEDLLMDVNVRGTETLVNAALNSNIRKFCHVSSTAAIGKPKNAKIVTEKANWNENENPSKYGISKHHGEREVWRGIEEGLNAVIVNPCIVIGPGDWGKSSTNLFVSAWNGMKYYTEGANAFVDVRDISKIMIQLMESDISSQRFLLIGENMSFRKLFNLMCDALSKPRPSVKATPTMAQIAWRLDWLRSKLTGRPQLITKETAQNAQQVTVYDNTKIKETLGITFASIDQAVKHSAQIFLKQYP